MFHIAKALLFGVEDASRENDPDESEPYEQKAKVDQVLSFFELEYDLCQGWLTPEQKREMEEERINYYNAMNGVDFQNEQICYLVDALLQLRKERPLTKEQRIQFEHFKLDMGERKTKRAAKERERQACLARIRPLIAELQIRKLEEQMAGQKAVTEESTGAPDQSSTSFMAHVTAPTIRQRKRHHHYSDSELTSLLQDF